LPTAHFFAVFAHWPFIYACDFGFHDSGASRYTASMFRRLLFVLILTLPAYAVNPNIILITLGSARADRMGFLGSKRPTPALDALAKQSVVFEKAYAQAPLTVVSHASLLTGTYPQTNQITEFGSPLAPSLPYLPDLLRARGYRTAAFVGSIALDPRNGLAPGFDRGFDSYDAGFQLPQKGVARSQAVDRRADVVITRATAWLAHAKSPFFLWIYLADAASANNSAYDAAVERDNTAISKLITALHSQKLYDDAAILVAADHGESLGDDLLV
jgi:arylsulfatase A-like enzyme